VHVVPGDILGIDPISTLRQVLSWPPEQPVRYKVVANLPYYITSAVVRHLLGAQPRPELLVLMVQSEVAERIAAQPGELSLLALGVQVYGAPEIVCRVPSRAFFPAPQVDSAVLRVRVAAAPRVPEAELAGFFRVAQAGFAQKRKQLHNSLMHTLHLPASTVLQALECAAITPDRRPQTLSIEEWAALARVLAAPNTP
jgi:16S rRNA (adenine1518-N6/adenine1519-N6)-dimethyltransferase